MAEAFGMAPGNPVLAGLAGVLQGLPGGLNTFLQQRQLMQQRDEEQKRKGLQTLAEIMKLPRNMRGPMLGEVIKSGGVNPTLGQTLLRADEQQGQDIATLLEKGGVEDSAGMARLLETPDQAITMYNKAVEARRKREEDERLAKALGPGAGEAPQPETLGALVGPQPAPAQGPPAGRAFASVPPVGRLDVDPSIGPPGAPEPMGGAMPGGGMPGGGMAPGGDTLRALLGARPPLMAAAAPAVPGLGALPFGGQPGLGPAPQPLAPPVGAPVGPVVPPGGTIPPGAGPAPMPAEDLGGEALKHWRQYEGLTGQIEALGVKIARVEAVGTEAAFKRADALRKDQDALVKRQGTVLTAIDKASPDWMEPKEIPDPADPTRTVIAMLPKSGVGPPRILGSAPAKPMTSNIGRLQEDLARLKEDPQKNAAAIAAAERELGRMGVIEPASELLRDRAAAVQQYGERSPQVAAIDKSIAAQREVTQLGPAKTRADIAQSQAAAESSRANTARIIQDAREGRKPKPSDISAVRNDYIQESKPFVVTRDFYRRMQAASNTAEGDITRIYAFMKMQDPGSAVLPGEQATARNSAGVAEWVRNEYNRLIAGQGQGLTPQTRVRLQAEAARVYGAQRESHEQVRRHYTGIANRAGITPADIVPEETQAVPPPGTDPRVLGDRARQMIRTPLRVP